MKPSKKHQILFIVLSLALVIAFLINLALGQVAIPLKEVVKSLFGEGASKETWDYIIIHFRLPKAITALLTGMGLATAGLLMQTFFRNPLAGPYVLGLSSGSSLGVAFVVMGASLLPATLNGLVLSSFGVIAASCLGSFIVLLLVLAVAQQLRDTASLLIVGLMFSSFTSAVVSVLTYFSTAEQLQKFTFWSMGNLGNLNWNQIALLAICVGIGLLLALFCLKPLDALLLGENYAASMGVPIKNARLKIILATSLLAGSITAFAGPIAFVGLAVPHMAKLLFQSGNHKILFPATLLCGGITVLCCDTVSQLPGFEFTLPLNAITSLIGAPVVIWLLVRKKAYI